MSSANQGTPAPAAVEAEFDIGSTDDTLPHMMRDFAALGDVYRWLRPGKPHETWVVSDPETIKRVLVGNHRNYTIGVGLDRVKVLVGNGIIVSEGDLWRRQHRMMQPMFQRSQIERFGPMMTDVTRRRVASWCERADRGESSNVTKDCSEGALEVVLRAVFGADYDRLCVEGGSNPFAMLSEETERDLRFAYRFRQLGKHIEAVIARRESTPAADAQIDWLAMMMASRDRDGQPMS